MAKKFALIKTFANGNKGVSLVADKQRPKEAFLKACKGNDVVEVELFRMERVKRIRVKVQAEEKPVEEVVEETTEATSPAVEQPTEETTETTSSAVEQEETQPTNANKGKGGKGRGNK